jgi:hypothetical protein
MNMKKNLVLLVGVFLMGIMFLGLTTGLPAVSHAGDTPQTPGPFPMFGMAGICADQQYLYAVAGGKVLQYTLTSMSLVKTADLPEPLPPPSVSATGMDAGACQSGNCPPPPHFARSQWLLVTGGYLYVMMGPMIHQYRTADLVLQSSVELPKPELP